MDALAHAPTARWELYRLLGEPVRLRLLALARHEITELREARVVIIAHEECALLRRDAHEAEQREQGEFWATAGEGTEGIVPPLLRDPATRIYYVEGSHDGRFLPRVSGKAVVLLRLHPVTDNRGVESIDSTMVTYLRLDNRFLSGMLSLLRPLIGNVVNRQILKAFDAARRLGGAMREHSEQVLFEATDPPGLPDAEVAFLKAAIAALHNPPRAPQPASQ